MVATDAWSPEGVRGWRSVAQEARLKHEAAHVGRLFGICADRNPVVPTGHPEPKFRGRLVFQESEARCENSHYAISDELYSNPATLEASTSIYAHGLFPDHGLQQADREQDYT